MHESAAELPAEKHEQENTQEAADRDSREISRLRKLLPQQVLLPQEVEGEIAQHSYKAFKETREELLERLIDPQISLEDAARILNVCPTTVRRYTNRGLLKHIRTPGNQRRFKLSEVLSLLESQGRDVEETLDFG
jgi:excisionase family DNA binding protein